MSEPHHCPVPGPSPDAARRRDQGVRRVSNATRWSFAAAAAGTAALGLTYLHQIPGALSSGSTPIAPVQAGQPAHGWTCTTTTATTPVPAPVRPGDGERDGEGADRAAAPAPAPTSTTTCVTTGSAPGLAPPGQPPSATQQAPQTRTGAS